MAYQIDRYNNTLLTVVEDGTVDQTTDLKFIGKNYAGYGEIQNENFLFLLENFAGANQPSRPLSGQVWYDSANSKLKFYDGTKWRTTGGAEISETQPSGLANGDFWWDTANEQLYVFNGTDFILIGPQNAGEGITQIQSLEVLDTTGNLRSILAATVEDTIVYIISASEFDLNDANPIDGFDRIKQGLTLKNTQLATNGVTTPADWWYWGTASNADKLGGIDASNYITSLNPEFASQVGFPDAGVAIGDSDDLKLYVENGSEGVIENSTGNNSIIKLKVTNGTGDVVHVATINSLGLVPAQDNTFDIGTTLLRWKDVHAVRFVGTATTSSTLLEGTSQRVASRGAVADTVAVRDATGSLAANLFEGTATAARYADLAEKYTTDQEYPVGTVMAVCEHGDHETEAAPVGSIAIGVISENPAIMMNSEAEGQYIGLKGRVPVRIIGSVKKGQAVYVHGNGCASTVIDGGCLVGIALESNSDESEKLVECVLKV
jgi:hypothetical protein